MIKRFAKVISALCSIRRSFSKERASPSHQLNHQLMCCYAGPKLEALQGSAGYQCEAGPFNRTDYLSSRSPRPSASIHLAEQAAVFLGWSPVCPCSW